MNLGEVLAEQLDYSRGWTLKLIADVRGDDWSFQPGPGLAHALWHCGHLACSQDLLIHVRCLRTPGLLEKSFTAHFPIGGPVKSMKEHPYPTIEAIRTVMDDVHQKTIKAVSQMSEDLLNEPCMGGDGKPHPHYRDKKGAIAHCSRHEGFHAGQVALIRRLLGKSFLR